LRLEPTPGHRASLRIVLSDRGAIPTVVTALATVAPSAVELFDRSFLRLVGEAAGVAECAALLLVDVEDDDPARLARRLDQATAAVMPLARHVTAARDPDAIASLWALRHAASPILAGLDDGRRSLQAIEDGCVPLAALPAYLDRVEAACRENGIDAVMFGHAGDGHVHVNLLPDLGRPDWLEAVGRIYRDVTDTLVALGGTPAGEHGAGRLRGGLLERFLGPEAVAAMAAIKEAFDPAGLFNPGVIVGADPEPLRRLKVGPDRAEIPAAIERMLWRVEAERRWGESRW
jgi:D-lactate dehydrogenase